MRNFVRGFAFMTFLTVLMTVIGYCQYGSLIDAVDYWGNSQASERLAEIIATVGVICFMPINFFSVALLAVRLGIIPGDEC